jgi:DNA repair protein RadC
MLRQSEVQASYSIQQLPESERPRERLIQHGAEALSAAELLAIILGSGTKSAPVLHLAQKLLAHFGCLQQLGAATVEELCQIKGIGTAKAVQIRAAFSLGQRMSRNFEAAKYKIEHPVHAYQLVKDALQFEKQERFLILLQNAKGVVIGQHTVAIGSLTQVFVHPREVFYLAIRHKAATVIAIHNHPSGDVTPSPADFELTSQLIAAGKIIGIPLNDHLIVAVNGYFSFRQKSRMFQADGCINGTKL